MKTKGFEEGKSTYHIRWDTASNHARKEWNAVAFFFRLCAQHGRGQLTMITNQNKLTAASHQGYNNGGFGGLGCFVDKDAFQRAKSIKDVSSRTDAGTTNDLRTL